MIIHLYLTNDVKGDEGEKNSWRSGEEEMGEDYGGKTIWNGHGVGNFDRPTGFTLLPDQPDIGNHPDDMSSSVNCLSLAFSIGKSQYYLLKRRCIQIKFYHISLIL